MKATKTQLPYLARLLDDETPEIRKVVVSALEKFGPSLDDELTSLGILLTREEAKPIQHLLGRSRRKRFKRSWHEWLKMRDDKQRLETALSMIVDLQDGPLTSRKVPELLDKLAEEFREESKDRDALGLARFLFRKKLIQGAEQADYLNPLNSNLVYTIEEKKGLPITLACVFVLVGHRLNLAVEGCNFPGHFLAIAPVESKRVLVDCYNGGRTIDETALASIDSRVSLKDILRLECRSKDIITRVLRNLKNAYENTSDKQNTRLISDLLATMTEKASPAPL